ncbi:MAG: HAD-IIIA family hydrolase [Ruminococcus sp.]|jgi:phosphoglycolate phosphatase|nr:HAD-IIIA family hydrolase [Ruminococcus sp.]
MKLAVFDLDGTLADTIDDITAAVNHVMEHYGFPKSSPEDVKYMVGDGIKELMLRAFPEDRREEPELLAEALTIFKDYYNEHFCDYTLPYEGIIPMLDALKAGGVRLAVVTNKNEEAVELIVEKLFKGYFEIVIGNSDKVKQKPDPSSVLYIMDKLGAEKSDTFYIGDAYTDIYTAKNAGVKGIGVLWGFRTYSELHDAGADFIVSAPSEIISIIGGEI